MTLTPRQRVVDHIPPNRPTADDVALFENAPARSDSRAMQHVAAGLPAGARESGRRGQAVASAPAPALRYPAPSMLPTLAVQLGTLLSVAVGFGLGWAWRGQVSP